MKMTILSMDSQRSRRRSSAFQHVGNALLAIVEGCCAVQQIIGIDNAVDANNDGVIGEDHGDRRDAARADVSQIVSWTPIVLGCVKSDAARSVDKHNAFISGGTRNEDIPSAAEIGGRSRTTQRHQRGDCADRFPHVASRGMEPLILSHAETVAIPQEGTNHGL